MKNNFVTSLLCAAVAPFFCFGCSDDDGGEKRARLEISVTDTLGVPLQVYPLGSDNLEQDTLLRSNKILQLSGDSIVLEKEAFDFVFHITSNASWRLSKRKAWGSNASNTWLSNPKPTFGGGDSQTRTFVKENTKANERRAYIYFATGDSVCMKKYVILQKGSN